MAPGRHQTSSSVRSPPISVRPGLWLAACLFLAPAWQPAEAPTVETLAYIAGSTGDVWRFHDVVAASRPRLTVRIAEEVAYRGATVQRREEGQGDYRYQTMDGEKGLRVFLLHEEGEGDIELERPTVMVPARMTLGAKHRSQSRYLRSVGGARRDVGLLTYEVELEAIETVVTGAGEFRDCLRIRTSALRMDYSGSQAGREVHVWYARGVGPVKIQGDLFFRDVEGRVIRSSQLDLELDEAQVAGAHYGGPKR
jgi:hypothetical protein